VTYKYDCVTHNHETVLEPELQNSSNVAIQTLKCLPINESNVLIVGVYNKHFAI